jgi:hypothetical protein
MVEEILKAADCPHSTVDRDKLGRELALRNHWKAIQPLFSKASVTEKAKFASKVAEKAEKLLDLLLKNSSSNIAWKASVLKLSQEARIEAEREIPTMDLAVSAVEWVIGEYLADIYFRISGQKAGYSTKPSNGERGGPFVAFVEAVFRHNDIRNDDGNPYSKETIKKALTRVTQARSEKRVRPTNLL